jgi:uncharacterized membrane protein
MKNSRMVVCLICLWFLGASAYSYAQTSNASAPLHPCGGGFRVIEVPGAAPFTSAPTSINDEGVIVGDFQDANLAVHGFILKDGNFTRVNFPNGTNTHLSHINNRGQILGSVDSTPASQTPITFLLQDGKFTVLSFPGVAPNGILGFNDFDEFFGLDFSTGTEQAFVVVEGTRTNMPNFNGNSFFIDDINDRGVVLGAAATADNPLPSLSLILRYGQFSMLPAPPAGTSQVGATAINNRNEIVGSIQDINNMRQAFFLSDDGTYSLFGFPGDTENIALDLNDKKQVIGASQDSSFNTHRWVVQLCASN